MKKWITTACLAGLLAMTPGLAKAATFTLGDHPNGDLAGNGAYGLRIDQTLWSVAGVTLTYDQAAATASLSGQLQMTYTNIAARMQDDPELWQLEYTFSGVNAIAGDSFTATGGAGTLTDLHAGHYDYFDLINLAGKQDNGLAFIFGPNGWRLPGDETSLTGRGWVMASNATQYIKTDKKDCKYLGGNYDKNKGKCKFDLGGTQDFLFTASNDGDVPPVPEPGTMLLTLGGVALLWFRKRRS